MELKYIRKQKNLNIFSIAVYLLTYYFAFFNVEEILATYYFDDYRRRTPWDDYGGIMALVSIAFIAELVIYKILQDERRRRWKFTSIVTAYICQIMVIGYTIYIGMNGITDVDSIFKQTITINILRMILSIFMIIQFILWLMKCRYLIYDLKNNIATIKRDECDVLKDELESELDGNGFGIHYILVITLMISMFAYDCLCITSSFAPWSILIKFLFGFITLYVPYWLLLHIVISDLISRKYYIYAIVFVLLYMLAFNSAYRHLVDRYFYNGEMRFLWMNFIIECVNILGAVISILLILLRYRKIKRDEEFVQQNKLLNGWKQKKLLIALVALILLATPVGSIDDDYDYTYRTFFYSITYINMDTYNEPGEYVGVEVKLLGFKVYRNIDIAEPMYGDYRNE